MEKWDFGDILINTGPYRKGLLVVFICNSGDDLTSTFRGVVLSGPHAEVGSAWFGFRVNWRRATSQDLMRRGV